MFAENACTSSDHLGRSQARMLIGPRPDAVCSLTGPSENVGTYGPSFGPLCTVTFEVERERAPSKNIQRPGGAQ